MVRVAQKMFAEIKAKIKKAAQRKAKRAERVEDLRALGYVVHLPNTAAILSKQRRRRLPSPWKTWRDRLDAVFALFIKLRDRKAHFGLCALCGVRPIQVAYHILQRGFLAIRWDPRNAVGACSRCNWAELRQRQQHPERLRDRHIKVFGLATIEYLEAKRHEIFKPSVDDLKALVDKFRVEIKKI